MGIFIGKPRLRNSYRAPHASDTGVTPIYYDPRWFGQHGIGRFAQEVIARIPGAQPLTIAGPKLSPIDPIAISAALLGKRAGCYFSPGFNPPLASPIPFAFTIHDLIHLKVPQESSPLRRLYYTSVVRPATRRAKIIFTVSEYSKKEIIDWANIPEERVIVAGNAPAHIFQPEGPCHDPGYPYFLHVGRRAAHKNIARLLSAFAATSISRKAKLFFTGHPDAATRKLVSECHLDGQVKFTGPIDDSQLAEYYRGAIALIFPSLYEGFGLPIVEAMACGTPVITARVTAMEETAGHGNALFVDPYDTHNMSGLIDELAHSDNIRRQLGAAGIARVQKFSWDDTASVIAKCLQIATS